MTAASNQPLITISRHFTGEKPTNQMQDSFDWRCFNTTLYRLVLVPYKYRHFKYIFRYFIMLISHYRLSDPEFMT